MKKILIIGAGAMGSAFAVPCIENKNDVTIVGTHLEDNLIKDIISNDHLHPALKTKLPKEIKFIQFNELQPHLKKDLDLIKLSGKLGAERALNGESGVIGLDDDNNALLSLINFERIKGGKPFDHTVSWFNQLLMDIGQK